MTAFMAVISTGVAIYWLAEGAEIGSALFSPGPTRWGPYFGGGWQAIIGLCSIIMAAVCWSSLLRAYRRARRRRRNDERMTERIRERYAIGVDERDSN